jgi:acyl-coenzyme A synthetase/AMP-(fatty) acid ligase
VVAAAVVRAPGFDRDALVAHLAALGPHHRPRRLAYLDALPVGANGKIDRRATAAIAAPLLVPVGYP